MYKTVAERPDWLATPSIQRICSVSPCVSADFTDWINFWKHNGYWFFDSPEIISDLAKEHHIPIGTMTLFFYQAYEKQWHTDTESWQEFSPEKSFVTKVIIPEQKAVMGYDVVTYSSGNAAECSPLSCNSLAREIPTNEHCLLPTFDNAVELIESAAFSDSEPGPLRVIEVNTVRNP